MDLDFIWVSAAGLGTGSITGILLFLILRLRKKPEMVTGQYNTSFVFSGNLKQTNLLDAIQFLEIGRREGILHIYCGGAKDI